MRNEKTIILAIAVYAAAMIMIFNIIGAQAQVPVKSANATKEVKSDQDIVHDDVADFRFVTADARTIDEQGRETQKGTQSKIREDETEHGQ